MQRLLFICSRNRLRSPTAEQVFAGRPGIETASAGLAPDADDPLRPDHLDGVDLVFVMERVHQTRLSRQFGPYLRGKKIVCLNIPDNYRYMQPELVRLLEQRVTPHLR
ncbi:MAG TPA: low molecular weight protein tyrosine phosphatase family protein [Devosiaceae bacterium]|nr:low molecular weight protein tyrosine phosphatase family protein [Devosiaceae bacterium]